MTDMRRGYNIILQSNVDNRFSQTHSIITLFSNKDNMQKDVVRKEAGKSK